MPRGKVIKRSLDEQINMLEEDIRTAQNKLTKLQAKLKDLQKQKREEDMADLYSLVKESGLSLDEVRQALAATPAREREAAAHCLNQMRCLFPKKDEPPFELFVFFESIHSPFLL